MYNEDWPTISTYALQSPQQLYRVGCFILATVNQHLEQVPRVMRIMQTEGSSSKQLAPNTRRGIDALASEAQGLYNDFTYWHTIAPTYGEAREARETVATQAIFRMVQLPGFGIVKAGFYAQLVLGIGGCLDRWNLRRAGLDEKVFSRIPTNAEALQTRIATYAQTCEALGGSETLWNQWCCTLSTERPKRWPTPDAVSKFHVTCICEEDNA